MNVELPAALLELPWILTQPRFRLPHPPHSHRSPEYLSDFAGVLVTATLQLGCGEGPLPYTSRRFFPPWRLLSGLCFSSCSNAVPTLSS